MELEGHWEVQVEFKRKKFGAHWWQVKRSEQFKQCSEQVGKGLVQDLLSRIRGGSQEVQFEDKGPEQVLQVEWHKEQFSVDSGKDPGSHFEAHSPELREKPKEHLRHSC